MKCVQRRFPGLWRWMFLRGWVWCYHACSHVIRRQEHIEENGVSTYYRGHVCTCCGHITSMSY